ncbi:cytoplasmic dynein 2 light intermediate chain 1 [Bacillus rossius redtenbacheri]|uniref:cytoplasmic dynein 2 light intermediate chain 1 n=1 Tax=Bacillus rossius redtenbacheri TaxID=93214 RepID=UPI002FDD9DBE
MPATGESLKDIAVRMNREAGEIHRQSAGGQCKESTLILLGSKDVGKSSLVHRFLDRDEPAKQTLALEYTFGRKAGRSLVKDVCHIWELGGGTMYPSLLATPLAAAGRNLSQVTVVLMLDLSALNQLWFTMETLLQSILTILRAHCSQDQMNSLQELAWARIGYDNPDKDLMDPFPCSLVILGGKYDVFQDFDSEKKKIVCRCLRYVAHTLGASLQFYSVKDAGLVKKAKDLLSHHGFGSAAVKSISQDHNKPLLIPAGSDSMERIGGVGTSQIISINKGPGAALDRWKHIFTKHFPQEVTEKSVIPDDPAHDINFKEAIIDSLRAQRDDELDRFRREAESRHKYLSHLELDY